MKGEHGPQKITLRACQTGEKSTWHRLEQLRLSSKIGKTLDVILDEHPENDAKTT
jgi:hypothetical protein